MNGGGFEALLCPRGPWWGRSWGEAVSVCGTWFPLHFSELVWSMSHPSPKSPGTIPALGTFMRGSESAHLGLP